MKMKWVAAFVIGLTTTAQATVSSLPTEQDKFSYSIGVDLGKHFKQLGIELNPEIFTQGLNDGRQGSKLLLTDEEMKTVLTNFQKTMMTKRAAEFNAKMDNNKKQGETFLNDNKGKPEVVQLPSGLQYKIITKGAGPKPTANDTVSVTYKGHTIDGKVFDQSEDVSKPATFKVSDVIPGWKEALQLMPVGSTWELYVPANLAYGARSVGESIGPNETLIFTVHLISINKAAT